MFSLFSQTNADIGAKLAALDRSQAIIEFDLDGNILTANRNFFDTVGYGLDEVRGKHHSLFVDPDLRSSAEYAAFWTSLKQGEYQAGRSGASAKAGARSGSRRATTRFSAGTASRSRSSSSPPTSPGRCRNRRS